jgi:RNA polymerase sigma factor (sigma-70 family)
MRPPASGLPARLILGSALRAQSDARLVRLVRQGHDSAFEEIVRRYRRPLDRFAASIVGSHADDVTQDSFRKALVALRQAEADIELRPWLFRIVRNTALTDLRDRPPAAAQLAEELVVGGRSAAAEAERRAELKDLTARLRALPDNQRAALVMRELEGMSHEEIAAALGISGGAARQAIARARAAVRSGLGMLIPLPQLRVLADGGAATAGAGATVGGGAAVAGGGALGTGAVKAVLATVVVAGAVGAGVAIEQQAGKGHGPDGPQGSVSAPNATRVAPAHLAPSPASSRVDRQRSVPGGSHRPAGRHAGSARHAAPHPSNGEPGHRLMVATPAVSPEAAPSPVRVSGGAGIDRHGSGGGDGGGDRRGSPHDGSGGSSGGEGRGGQDDGFGEGSGSTDGSTSGGDGSGHTAETATGTEDGSRSGSDDQTPTSLSSGDGESPGEDSTSSGTTAEAESPVTSSAPTTSATESLGGGESGDGPRPSAGPEISP